jgi:hypothetical protein
MKDQRDQRDRRDRENKPVFAINPPIILTMNDEMAEILVEFLEGVAAKNAVPPVVHAFMKTLQSHLP